MKRRLLLPALLGALAALTATLTGCVQMPTARQAVVDQRPALAFRFDPDDAALAAAVVTVDGLPSGRIGDYPEGGAVLRLQPGTHAVRVDLDGAPLFDERLYLGDGAVRPLPIRRTMR